MSEEIKQDTEEFDVIISTKENEDTIIITSKNDLSETLLSQALSRYDATNQIYSTYLKDNSTGTQMITPELLDSLAEMPQSDINKILQINSIIRNYINKDDIIGKTVESIETNVNTEYKLSYNNIVEGKNKVKKLDDAKEFIDSFNNQINLRNLIRKSIPITYAEGTYITYLRHKDNGEYIVDYYPIGVVEISDYDVGGIPVVLINVQELRNRLSKIYKKNKKNKALFFSSMEEEVKANYPIEVYNAFVEKEQYAKLDTKYIGVLRIGNLNRKYGLSPIFRAIRPTLMLETFELSDRVTSKAKAKKIIFQKLRKEVLGADYNKKGFEEMAYAHDNFMQAWKQPTVVVTAPAQVESISYVESKTELTDVNTVNSYRSKVLNTLGIGFLMDSSSQSVSTASISVSQLLRTINKISEQLEDILYRWHKQILIDNGFPPEYTPKTKIIDCEALEMDIKLDMASFLYTTLNASLETVYNTVGLDLNDEIAKRKLEKENGLEKLFTPRATSYNSNGSNSTTTNTNDVGRPADENQDSKNVYDEEYNKTR